MPKPASKSSRSRRKGGDIDTRQALLDAALELMNRDKSFDAISLREVTREVGVSPAAFYRHFSDMDELGLELVNTAYRTLRTMLKTVRQQAVDESQMVRRSVETLVTYIRSHRRHFQFLARERYGGVAAVREEIHHELKLLATELSEDLKLFENAKYWTDDDLKMFSDLMISAMLRIGDQLVMARRRGEDDDAFIQLAEKQLRLITLGAKHWRSPEVTAETNAKTAKKKTKK